MGGAVYTIDPATNYCLFSVSLVFGCDFAAEELLRTGVHKAITAFDDRGRIAKQKRLQAEAKEKAEAERILRAAAAKKAAQEEQEREKVRIQQEQKRRAAERKRRQEQLAVKKQKEREASELKQQELKRQDEDRRRWRENEKRAREQWQRQQHKDHVDVITYKKDSTHEDEGLQVSGCSDPQIAEKIEGYFQRKGTLHGRPIYQKVDGKANDTYVYYVQNAWGHEWDGWWFGKLDENASWSCRHRSSASRPPKSGWCVPHNGKTDFKLAVTPCLRGTPTVDEADGQSIASDTAAQAPESTLLQVASTPEIPRRAKDVPDTAATRQAVEVSDAHGNRVGMPSLVGTYRACNMVKCGRPVFRRVDQREDMVMYFFDARDGHQWCGWWIGRSLTENEAFAHNSATGFFPPRSGWQVPWEGAIDPGFVVTAIN